MHKVHAYGAASAGAPIRPMTIERRDVGPNDVAIDVLFAGICHSDIHQARDEWGGASFPMVPGHEIVGRVSAIGAAVKKLAVGDIAGVGCMVDSCRTCGPCAKELQQFCEKGVAWTYNGTEMDRKTPTYGGYSARVVVTEHFALKVPKNLDASGAAPLLCAGITTFSPIKRFGVKKGDRVGIVGLGGLGHMGVKIAASMGAEVTILSTSRKKEADARRLGAHHFAVTTDAGAFDKLKGQFDFLLDTVSAPHDYGDYLKTVATAGTMVIVGVPPEPTKLGAFSLIQGNKTLAGSLIGGVAETQEMLDYCAAHDIVSDVEVIAAKDIDDAYERTLRGDVRYRFVIDAKTFEA
jgi:uncharacterized zinc-type alcohol dehydrogenase-like protein